MNLSLSLLCTLIFLGGILSAQTTSYSYQTDRSFRDITDLIGYRFIPDFLDVPDDDVEQRLKAGDYSFSISKNNLYMEGGKIAGVYNISTINPTEFGYIVKIINARNPLLQGHLKVILNDYAEVEALLFRRSKKEAEMVFHLPVPTKALQKAERAYFTDRWESKLVDKDSLWGHTVRPFICIHQDAQGQQERLLMADSAMITFIENVKVIEKFKKPKKERKPKKKRKKEEVLSTVDSVELEVAGMIQEEDTWADGQLDSLAVDSAVAAGPTLKKVKVVKEYFIKVKTFSLDDTGTRIASEQSFPIKSWIERKDDAAGRHAEKYQIELALEKGRFAYVYLTPRRTFSSIELAGKRFLMQGH